MVQVTEINELRELASLRSTWHALLKQTPGFSFFQTLEWLEAAWSHYSRPQKLRVILVERDGNALGIVPFCVRTEHRKLGSLRVLTYPLDDWGTFFGPISAEPELAYRAAIEHVARTPRDWDVIDLRYVDQAAPEFMALGESMRASGLAAIVRPRMEVRMLQLGGSWLEYVETRSRNWREKMRRDFRKLEKEGGEIRLLRYRPEAGAGTTAVHEENYRLCEEIAEKSWQADADSQSTLCSPRVRDLLNKLHHQAASLGMLDSNLLFVGDRPLAFSYNYVSDGRLYFLRSGFDRTAEFANCGTVLLYKMLEDSFHRGDVEHCFGPGRQPYKDRFATEMRYAYTFRHYARRSLRSQLLNLRDRAASRLFSEAAIIEKSLVS
jgi:CelD/BcsL family acetyltransferase involved in cellulose biosynthesis